MRQPRTRTLTVNLYEDVETHLGDAEICWEAEVTVSPRSGGGMHDLDPPEGGPELERLWRDGREITGSELDLYESQIEKLLIDAEDAWWEGSYEEL